MIFYTSDLHLGHANIIRHCNRPFASVEEMDEVLIDNWNAKVTNADTVHILGDFMFRNKRPPEEYLFRLKGKKHLVVGTGPASFVRAFSPEKQMCCVRSAMRTCGVTDPG